MKKPAVIQRSNVPSQVLEVLRERIFDRVYAPSERLNIDALARELAVSATPIREALGHLVAEGLANSEPYIGFSVAPMPSDSYYRELYDLRLVLEPWAAAQAAQRQRKDTIDTLATLLQAMDESSLSKRYRKFRTFTEADAAFHQAIVAGAGNAPALQAFQDLNIHLHLSRLFIDREQQTEETRRQHQEVFEAISAGDPETAAKKMSDHLNHSKSRLLSESGTPNPVSRDTSKSA